MVGVRFELHVVTDADRRQQNAQLGGQLAADHGDAIQQIAPLLRVDHLHQSVADLQLQRIDVEQLLDGRRAGLRLLGQLFGLLSPHALPGGAAGHITKSSDRSGQRQHRQRRQRRHRQRRQEPRRDDQRHRPARQLTGQLRAQIRRGTGPRDDQARGNRNNKRRQLRNQSVADRQPREDAERLGDVPALLEIADGKPADDVDQRNDNARDGVTAHKLRSTVHRTVEVSFAVDVLTPLAGFGFVDDAGVQVRVDGHLLARHAVESEPRRHF